MRTRLVLASLALLAVSAPRVRAQATDPAPQPPPAPHETKPPDPKSKPAAPASEPQRPSTAEQFPFPGEEKPAPDAPDAPGAAAPAPQGAAPQGAAKPDGKFPYPGDPEGDASSSASSSSSSSSSAPGDPDLPKEDQPPGRRKLPKEFHPQSSEDRATEDLEVARFYVDKGNLAAAYLRAQDAVRVLPNDPESHLLLGEIAGKLHHRDEAVLELQTYLKLEPDGEHSKQARRMLAQMH